jgi:hypothetical protein
MDIDVGHARLDELFTIIQSKDLSEANEATTRKLIIDRMLEECLGWLPGEDIKYNERVSEDGQTTFADYLLMTATTSIVVEAKRIGKAFNLPTDKTSGVLGGVISEGELGEAIRQARDYARKLSIQFAVATNGSAWVLFPATRTDRIPFEQGRATIFRDLTNIRERFVEFWDLMSRQRVMEGGLESSFFSAPKELVPRRIVSSLPEPGYRVGRNRIYEYIEPAVTAALTDEALLDDVDGLEKCYVKNAERAKFDSRISMHLKDIKPLLDRSVTRPRAGGDPQKLDRILEKVEIAVPRFILLLGPVGAGKSTFLHYTRKVSARSLIDRKVIWFDVDFKKATKGDDPKAFIFMELGKLIEKDSDFELSSWEHSIKPAYRDFIEARQIGTLAPLFRSAPQEFERRVAESIDREREDVLPFVERIVRNAAKYHPVYLVVDNVDQIDDEDYQQRVFIEAQAVARRLNCHVIMSLRDATYLRHKATPAFDAFQIDTLYIDPPPMGPVLSRRLNYAKRVLSGTSTHIRSESGAQIEVPDLGVFFEIVSTSLLSEPSGYLIEVLSGSDIRRGLEYVREFLASGHVSADHALITFLTDGSYRFPRHEIFRGIVFGQRKYYQEENSCILNIFDSKLGSFGTQLIRLRILARLTALSREASYEGTSYESLVSDMHKCGIPQEMVERAFADLYAARLLMTMDRSAIRAGSQIFPTRLGGYLVMELSATFMYFEPCLLDANIYSDEIWESLKKSTAEIESSPWPDRIELRISRAEVFLNYLRTAEERWRTECRRHGLDELWCNSLLDPIESGLRKDIDRVRKSAERGLRRKQGQTAPP